MPSTALPLPNHLRELFWCLECLSVQCPIPFKPGLLLAFNPMSLPDIPRPQPASFGFVCPCP